MAPPLVLFGIPSYGTVSAQWVMGRQGLSIPLGAATADRWLLDREMSIAEKRNQLARDALNSGAKYLMYIGDDTIPPAHAFIQMWNKMKFNPGVHIVTGMYFSRSYPPQPMVWRGYMAGSYYDWHVGEFFQVDWAGCDCLLVDTDVFRAIPEPWFSQDYVFGPTQARPVALATEDIYFYEKARKHGFTAWCDAGVQCIHQDRVTGQSFFLPGDWPQAQPGSQIKPKDDAYLVADIGAGISSPYTHGKLVRFDIDENVHPDVRCDVHQIPWEDAQFDEVWSRHVLEHFPAVEAPFLIQEWSRILKVGGKLVINVPNLSRAMRVLLDSEAQDIPTGEYPWWQLYGAQSTPHDFHKNGFTRRSLKKLIEFAWGDSPIHADPDDGVGVFGSIEVEEKNDGLNLEATAIKVRHPRPAIIGPEGRFSTVTSDVQMPVVTAQEVATQ